MRTPAVQPGENFFFLMIYNALLLCIYSFSGAKGDF